MHCCKEERRPCGRPPCLMAGIKRDVVVQITSLRASAKVNGDLPDAKLAFADEVDGFVLNGGEMRLLRGDHCDG